MLASCRGPPVARRATGTTRALRTSCRHRQPVIASGHHGACLGEVAGAKPSQGLAATRPTPTRPHAACATPLPPGAGPVTDLLEGARVRVEAQDNVRDEVVACENVIAARAEAQDERTPLVRRHKGQFDRAVLDGLERVHDDLPTVPTRPRPTDSVRGQCRPLGLFARCRVPGDSRRARAAAGTAPRHRRQPPVCRSRPQQRTRPLERGARLAAAAAGSRSPALRGGGASSPHTGTPPCA